VKLTLTPTTDLIRYRGQTVRRWTGTSDDGAAVEAYVAAVRVERGTPLEAAADAELVPSVPPVLVPDLDPHEAMHAIRAALLELSRRHEATCPGGGAPCWRDRASTIAWLAHALALGRHDGGAGLLVHLARWDRECSLAECRHGEAP
jgi:hypothetical protein